MKTEARKFIEQLADGYASSFDVNDNEKHLPARFDFIQGAAHPQVAGYYRTEGKAEAFEWVALQFERSANLSSLSSNKNDEEEDLANADFMRKKAKAERDRLAALLGKGGGT